jgi:predicted sugar kinase
VSSSIAAAYHQVFAGVAGTDFELFRRGLHTMRYNAFKRIEVAEQDATVVETLSRLESHDGIACSMSSVGPLIFAICRAADESAIRHITDAADRHAIPVHWALARNSGSSPTGAV